MAGYRVGLKASRFTRTRSDRLGNMRRSGPCTAGARPVRCGQRLGRAVAAKAHARQRPGRAHHFQRTADAGLAVDNTDKTLRIGADLRQSCAVPSAHHPAMRTNSPAARGCRCRSARWPAGRIRREHLCPTSLLKLPRCSTRPARHRQGAPAHPLPGKDRLSSAERARPRPTQHASVAQPSLW